MTSRRALATTGRSELRERLASDAQLVLPEKTLFPAAASPSSPAPTAQILTPEGLPERIVRVVACSPTREDAARAVGIDVRERLTAAAVGTAHV